MNSRGKGLTEFESFKARIEQHIQKIDVEEGTDICSEFSEKIDAAWTDLFWYYRDTETNLFDDQLMNFIQAIVTNHYALTRLQRSRGDEVLRSLTNKSEKHTFSYYELHNCVTRSCIEEISGALDCFTHGEGAVRTYLTDPWLLNEKKLFEKAIQNDLTYTDRIIFFSLYKYLIRNEVVPEELADWIRVIRNLAVNTIYNEAVEIIRSIQGVEELLSNSRVILAHLSNPDSAVQGFVDIQITEERIKAILVRKGENWKEAVYRVERPWLFRWTDRLSLSIFRNKGLLHKTQKTFPGESRTMRNTSKNLSSTAKRQKPCSRMEDLSNTMITSGKERS
jgi:hypothetical protein